MAEEKVKRKVSKSVDEVFDVDRKGEVSRAQPHSPNQHYFSGHA